ncbi:glycosyltransferase [Gammaproteobacteria bacterium]|nr:glycosyltransferase [Gammaproteobacteria bacterium]
MPNFNGGGAEKVNIILANHFSKTGHSVTMVVLEDIGENVGLLDSQVDLVVLGYTSGRFKWTYFFQSLFKLTKLFKKKRGMLISGVFFNNLQCGILKRVSNLKIMVVEHTIRSKNDDKKFILKRLMRPLTKYYLEAADNVVCVSNAIKLDLMRSYDNLNAILTVIHNPCFVEVEDKTISRTDRFHFGFVGRLVEIKNIFFIIDAFKEALLEESPSYLYIYGEGPLRQQLASYIAEQGLENRIYLVGYHKSLRNIYSNIDCLLLASDYEGFGNVIVEALSFGVPTLSTDDSGGPSELIVHGVTGLIVPRSDYSKGMLRAIKTNFDRSTLVDSARSFDTSSVAMEYLKLID